MGLLIMRLAGEELDFKAGWDVERGAFLFAGVSASCFPHEPRVSSL
jgi:hypothetical protein